MPSIPNHPHRYQPKYHHPRPAWRALDLVLTDPHRFRRLMLLLLLITTIATEPTTLPRLLTHLVHHTLLR